VTSSARQRTAEAARYLSPVAVLCLAASLSLFVLPALTEGTKAGVFAAALTLDFMVVPSGLVYILLVRTKRAPWTVLVPTIAAGYALAAATLPGEHRALVNMARLLLVPAETALILYILHLAARYRRVVSRAAASEGDFATRFRAAAREVLSSRVPADILATEISILYYAFRWKAPPPKGKDSFTVHRESGYLAIAVGLILVILVETIALHLLVRLWSGTVAWALTGLSLYACLWLVGDYRGLVARRIRLTSTHLVLRMGLRWEAEIPRAFIVRVDRGSLMAGSPKRGDILVATLINQPNIRLELDRPVEVTGMYGLRRRVRQIWLRVDGAEDFLAQLRS
jgi:hypothetical protein